MVSALVTDLYELSMARVYLQRRMSGRATFSLFVRQLPPHRGFLVVAGLEDCLDYLEQYRFDPADLGYARDVLGYDKDTLAALHDLRFTGEVWAVPEGHLVLANEPLLEVSAPIAVAQLVESYLLNVVSFQTMVATKAARCRIAARGAGLVDFALRRTQGIDAAMQVARLSAMVGFAATSNVEAARRFGLTAAGTMAHSFVEAFENEEAAFRAFAATFPEQTVLLVDTYDTLVGVAAAARVINELGLPARSGVRLDSGDLAELARASRRILDEAGLPQARIVASGGLDEYRIDALVRAEAPIDTYGVGTRMGVSADAPYLDSAYKLVEYLGRPVLKLSPGKVTVPGRKQVFRRPGLGDVIGLREEPAPDGSTPLLERVMVDGHRLRAGEPLPVARQRFEADLREVPESALLLEDPVPPVARFSAAAEEQRRAVTQRLAGRRP